MFRKVKKLSNNLNLVMQKNRALEAHADHVESEIERILDTPYHIILMNYEIDISNSREIVQSLKKREAELKKQGVLTQAYFREKHIDIHALYVTIIELSGEHTWYDKPDEPFNKIVLITRRQYEKEFHFANLQLNLDDGAEVNGQAARCWFVRWDTLPDNIPLIFSAFTEKDIQEEYLHLIADVNMIRTFKEKVLRQMVIDLLEKQRSLQSQIQTEQVFAEIATKREARVRKRAKTELVKLDNNMKSQLSKVGHSLATWKLIALGSGWGLAIIFLGILLGVVV